MTTLPAAAPPLVEDCLAIAAAGMSAVDGRRAVVRALEQPRAREVLEGSRRVVAVTIGKAAAAMHAGLREGLDARLQRGLVVALEPLPFGDRTTSVVAADHPLPTVRSRDAGLTALGFLGQCKLRRDDAVVLCLSGGGSAMAAVPRPPLDVADLAAIGRALLRSGWDVTTMNVLRQRLSAFHAGALAAAIEPARCLVLVIVDNIQVGAAGVASGPLSPPLGSPRLAARLVAELELPAPLRQRALAALGRVSRPAVVPLIPIATPQEALDAAAAAARRRRFEPVVLSEAFGGEARLAAEGFAAALRAAGDSRPTCVLAAGEVTVTLNGNAGEGGRCQEMAWAMAPSLFSAPAAFAAVASDGCDYRPGIGGAWVNGETAGRLVRHGLDWEAHLHRHDTGTGLERLGQLLPGGLPQTNVCDLYVGCWDGAGSR